MTQVNHAALKRCSCPDHEGPNPLPVAMFSPSAKRGQAGVHSQCKACRATAGRLSRRADLATSEKFKPCLVCGQDTRGPLQVCQRTTACSSEYARHRFRQQHGPVEQPPPCLVCGRPTTSVSSICARASCINEYRRRERVDQQSVQSVYGVWIPVPRILKVGFTGVANSAFVNTARVKAGRRGWDIEGTSCIWKQPGDTRTEAWMQATLAFRWAPAFEQKHKRVCEWYKVPALSAVELLGILSEVYAGVPIDTVPAAA